MAPLLAEATLAIVNNSVESSRYFEMSPLFNDPFFRRFFDMQPARRQQMSAGSGVIIDVKERHVLTSHHVVENGARIFVTLKDRLSFHAKLVGSAPGTDSAAEAAGLQAGDLMFPSIDAPCIKAHLENLATVKTAFEAGLKALGVRMIGCKDTSFDPELHEAVQIKETEETKPGNYLALDRPGFAIERRLIRPAHVKVSAAPNTSEKELSPAMRLIPASAKCLDADQSGVSFAFILQGRDTSSTRDENENLEGKA